ncbi:putative protein RP420 [Holospora elegans E1]|uniref:DUF3576 domain-containing protein n=1 Tax=Holospora elegans E1 TaxID=1427503 RepID=A0A023DZ77_9PROT|nr:putative protein RP420 [Holospora elegans E1]GAJ46846.1 putative protein RP420 [Holospora elegans E1]
MCINMRFLIFEIETWRTLEGQFLKIVFSIVVSTAFFLFLGCQELRSSEKVGLPTERQLKTYDNMKPLFPSPLELAEKKSEPFKKAFALWYGALKALARIPLEIFDPERGFLQTHWYIPKDLPNHRLQVKVCIIPCQEIRVEALSVTVLHQVLKQEQWIIIPTSLELEQKIKRSILLHARDYAVQNK